MNTGWIPFMKDLIDRPLAKLQGQYLFNYRFFEDGLEIETFKTCTTFNPFGHDIKRYFTLGVYTFPYSSYNEVEDIINHIEEIIIHDQY